MAGPAYRARGQQSTIRRTANRERVSARARFRERRVASALGPKTYPRFGFHSIEALDGTDSARGSLWTGDATLVELRTCVIERARIDGGTSWEKAVGWGSASDTRPLYLISTGGREFDR